MLKITNKNIKEKLEKHFIFSVNKNKVLYVSDITDKEVLLSDFIDDKIYSIQIKDLIEDYKKRKFIFPKCVKKGCSEEGTYIYEKGIMDRILKWYLKIKNYFVAKWIKALAKRLIDDFVFIEKYKIITKGEVDEECKMEYWKEELEKRKDIARIKNGLNAFSLLEERLDNEYKEKLNNFLGINDLEDVNFAKKDTKIPLYNRLFKEGLGIEYYKNIEPLKEILLEVKKSFSKKIIRDKDIMDKYSNFYVPVKIKVKDEDVIFKDRDFYLKAYKYTDLEKNFRQFLIKEEEGNWDIGARMKNFNLAKQIFGDLIELQTIQLEVPQVRIDKKINIPDKTKEYLDLEAKIKANLLEDEVLKDIKEMLLFNSDKFLLLKDFYFKINQYEKVFNSVENQLEKIESLLVYEALVDKLWIKEVSKLKIFWLNEEDFEKLKNKPPRSIDFLLTESKMYQEMKKWVWEVKENNGEYELKITLPNGVEKIYTATLNDEKRDIIFKWIEKDKFFEDVFYQKEPVLKEMIKMWRKTNTERNTSYFIKEFLKNSWKSRWDAKIDTRGKDSIPEDVYDKIRSFMMWNEGAFVWEKTLRQ